MQLRQAFHLLSIDRKATELKPRQSAVEDGGPTFKNSPRDAAFSDFLAPPNLQGGEALNRTSRRASDTSEAETDVDKSNLKRSDSDGESDDKPAKFPATGADPELFKSLVSAGEAYMKPHQRTDMAEVKLARAEENVVKANPIRHPRGVEGMILPQPHSRPDPQETISSPKGFTGLGTTKYVPEGSVIAPGVALGLLKKTNVLAMNSVFDRSAVFSEVDTSGGGIATPPFGSVPAAGQLQTLPNEGEDLPSSGIPWPLQATDDTALAGGVNRNDLISKLERRNKDITARPTKLPIAEGRARSVDQFPPNIAHDDNRVLTNPYTHGSDAPPQLAPNMPRAERSRSQGNHDGEITFQNVRPNSAFLMAEEPDSITEVTPSGTEGRKLANQQGTLIKQQVSPQHRSIEAMLTQTAKPGLGISINHQESAHGNGNTFPRAFPTNREQGGVEWKRTTLAPGEMQPFAQAENVDGMERIMASNTVRSMGSVQSIGLAAELTLPGANNVAVIPSSRDTTKSAGNPAADHAAIIAGVTGPLGTEFRPDRNPLAHDPLRKDRIERLPDTRTSEANRSANPLSNAAIRAQGIVPNIQFATHQQNTFPSRLTDVLLSDKFTADELTSVHGLEQARTVVAGQQHPLMKTDLPQHIPRQLAEIAHSNNGKSVDVALSPEELGRVKLSITSGENGIMVHITAERTDTLDLIRRHIDQLNQELRQLGYQDPGFSFGPESGDPDQAGSQAQIDDPTGSGGAPTLEEQSVEHATLSTGSTPGLDLRL